MIKKVWLTVLFPMSFTIVLLGNVSNNSHDKQLIATLDSIINTYSAEHKKEELSDLLINFKKENNVKAITYINYQLGVYYHTINLPDLAIHYFKLSHQTLIENRFNFDNLRRRNAYNISSMLRSLKKYDEALFYQRLAIKHSLSLKDSVKSIVEIGKIYNNKLGKYQIALDYLSHAEEIFGDVNSLNAITYLDLLDEKAQVFRNLGLVKESKEYYNLLLQMTGFLKDSIGDYKYYEMQFFVNLGLGNLIFDIDSFKKAEAYYLRTIEHATIIQDKEKAENIKVQSAPNGSNLMLKLLAKASQHTPCMFMLG